ncbi:hypothetical protein [Actinoplanes sp. NPDC026623]|uniref:hypothetical protein n=1 Tax=Actinoplanes sp. NPDC026623 TaxID=3155610 RepID=UPI0033F5765B
MGIPQRVGAAAVVAAAVAGSLSGCATPTGAAATPATTVPAVRGSASPMAVTTAVTPKPRIPAPALKITGTAWPAILTSLSGYGQWLLANPDPALVDSIATPGCAIHHLVYQQADGLLRDKAYLQPSAAVFSTVVGPTPSRGGSVATLNGKVILDVTASRPAETVVSRTGVPITTFDQLAPTALQITLLQGSDGGWRFCTINAQSDTGADDDPSLALL